MSDRLLLIDDDRRLFELLEKFLKNQGATLDHASGGQQGLEKVREGGFDAVLLDIMMPGMPGLEVLRQLRLRSSIPVLMLTARGDEADRVVGLELGADDYVPKPFSPRELLARVRAVLRRTQGQMPTGDRLSAGGVVVSLGSRTVAVHGQEVELTGIEFDILAALLRRAGRVIPRGALLEEAGRDEVTTDRTADVHISKLRKKLGDDPKHPRLIRTVRGVGYVFATGD